MKSIKVSGLANDCFKSQPIMPESLIHFHRLIEVFRHRQSIENLSWCFTVPVQWRPEENTFKMAPHNTKNYSTSKKI